MKIIQSIDRAAHILELFSSQTQSLGIAEMSRLTNLNAATVQGLVRTLLQVGFLRQNQETRKYHLGIKLYELGIASVGNLEITQRSSNLAYSLARRTKQHARVALFVNNSAIIIFDAYLNIEPLIFRYMGPRPPLYCTALGKAMLAFLDPIGLGRYLEQIELIPYTVNTFSLKQDLRRELVEIKGVGYAVNREERMLGRAALGAPIFGRQKQLIASICLAGHPEDILGERMEELIAEVKNTALEISFQMGYSLD